MKFKSFNYFIALKNSCPRYLLFRYVVFYLPFDVGYKALKFMPVRLMCEALKEVYRAKMVHDGVSHAAKLFPNAYLVMVSLVQ